MQFIWCFGECTEFHVWEYCSKVSMFDRSRQSFCRNCFTPWNGNELGLFTKWFNWNICTSSYCFHKIPKNSHAFCSFVWGIKTCHSRDVRVFFFEPIAAHEVGPCQQNNPKCCRVFLRNAYMLSIAIPRFCTKKCRCMRVCNTFSMLLPICFHPFPFVLVGGTIMFDKGHGQQFPLAVTRSQV